MRVGYFILIVVALHLCLEARSQRLPITGKGLTLPHVFAAIQQQTGYNFVYDADEVVNGPYLDLHLVNVTIGEAMDSCLRGRNLVLYDLSARDEITCGPPGPPAISEWGISVCPLWRTS